MRLKLKLVLCLEICIFSGSEAIGETQYQDFLAKIGSASRSIYQLFNGVPELKELPDCGKRYVRQRNEPKLSECFWNCQWRPNPNYLVGGGNFISFTRALDDILPDYYITFLNQNRIVFGTGNWAFNVEPIRDANGIIIGYGNIRVDLISTLPMIPTDTACLKDCYTRTQTTFDSRLDTCRLAILEELLQLPQPIDPTTPEAQAAFFVFFQCMELLNSQFYAPGVTIPGFPAGPAVFSYTKDFLQMTTEICLAAYLTPGIYTPEQRAGCDFIVTNCQCLGNNPRSVRKRKRLLKKLRDIRKKEGKGIFFKGFNQTSEINDIISRLYESSLTDQDSDGDRIVGASSYPVDFNKFRNSQHHPWLCSLRTRGFRGRHRCGVTLLSGPTEDSPGDPFVLVGAAHCNYICKDRVSGNVLETCCCRPEDNGASCVKPGEASPYCTGDPVFTLAEPSDLKIVCGEFDSGVEIVRNSFEPEQVFNIKRIVNHPKYQPNRDGIAEGGPIEGNDISVYHVETSFKLGMEVNGQQTRNNIWPVCLPKDDSEFTSNRGMIAGWLDSPPVNQINTGQLGNAVPGEGVIRLGFYPRVSNLEVQTQCQDPQYMRDRGVDTYYPQGTVCYAEPSHASCADFGISGSGVVREWKVFQQGPGIDFPGNDPQYQYSFVGPLSMSKGCDRTLSIVPNDINIPEFAYRGENPVVATDATCFMSWIAQEYGLKLPRDYVVKDTCSRSTGDKTDINKDVCWTDRNTRCDWDRTERETGQAKCSVFSQEGIAYNVNRCIDTNGFFAPCNNNCRGVDPNSIIGAGVAAATALGIAGTAFLGPVLGFGFGGLAGAGGSMLTRRSCPPTQCLVGNGCCDVIVVNGQGRCPISC